MTEPRLKSHASGRRAVDDRDVEPQTGPLSGMSNAKLCRIAESQGIDAPQKMTREQLMDRLRPGEPHNVVNEPDGPTPPAGAPDFHKT